MDVGYLSTISPERLLTYKIIGILGIVLPIILVIILIRNWVKKHKSRA